MYLWSQANQIHLHSITYQMTVSKWVNLSSSMSLVWGWHQCLPGEAEVFPSPFSVSYCSSQDQKHQGLWSHEAIHVLWKMFNYIHILHNCVCICYSINKILISSYLIEGKFCIGFWVLGWDEYIELYVYAQLFCKMKTVQGHLLDSVS